MSWSGYASSGTPVGDPRGIEWGSAARFRAGAKVGGDVEVVKSVPNGTLFAAIDGVGHGAEAARAATTTAEVIRGFASDDLTRLARECDEALRSTRGAALSAALISLPTGTLSWVGIGNVQGRLVSRGRRPDRSHTSLPLAAGVLGQGLPRIRPARVDLTRGDVLIFATDGISTSFADWLVPTGRPQEVADRIAAEHGKPTDDALVLVVRYLGRLR